MDLFISHCMNVLTCRKLYTEMKLDGGRKARERVSEREGGRERQADKQTAYRDRKIKRKTKRDRKKARLPPLSFLSFR